MTAAPSGLTASDPHLSSAPTGRRTIAQGINPGHWARNMTPLPPVLSTAASRRLAARTHCPYCAYQCGMLVGDGTADAPAAVQGDPHFPVNNGQLCVKGWTSTTLLRHPERLTTPLVRCGGELKPASWDAALDAVADAIRTTKERYGPDAV